MRNSERTDREASLKSLERGWCLSDESKSIFVDGRKKVFFTNREELDVPE